MDEYDVVLEALKGTPRRWLVTGGAGFIGSHLVEALLGANQHVVVVDNFATGRRQNLTHVMSSVGPANARRLAVLEGDIVQPGDCAMAVRNVDVVLHQAALGSVPRSIEKPLQTHAVNVTGFLNLLEASRGEGIKRVVYASSSSVYGDHPALPKLEKNVGNILSPYAASKACDEAYASGFARCYGLELMGLRYFNVFGPRQDPAGPYAAVMPRWFAALLAGEEVVINGDGETSRDFCFVRDVVQANILAATTGVTEALGQVYNVAVGAQTTLNELFSLIREQVARYRPEAASAKPRYGAFRSGDVRHSLASIEKAASLLRYQPRYHVRSGLLESAAWYARGLTQ